MAIQTEITFIWEQWQKLSNISTLRFLSSWPANDSVIQLYLCSYELSSGYKPAPLELSHIKLTSTQEAMVDKLAENAHNVWARDRIRQGWTYGIQQVGDRNTLTVYSIKIKKLKPP